VHPAHFVLPWILFDSPFRAQIARTIWAGSDSIPRVYVIHKKSRATQIIRGADKMHQRR
jgi:hypothetical protein